MKRSIFTVEDTWLSVTSEHLTLYIPPPTLLYPASPRGYKFDCEGIKKVKLSLNPRKKRVSFIIPAVSAPLRGPVSFFPP